MKRFHTFFVVLITFSCWFNIASAQVVKIPDANLASAVREALGLAPDAPITKQALQSLTKLDFSGQPGIAISNLTGLEHATALQSLALDQHQISDLSPLARLTKLEYLFLGRNKISDITPLTNLTKLSRLGLWNNQIRDITPLANLTQLTRLFLGPNQISNIAPLAKLTQLEKLSLSGNQISDISPLAKLTQLRELYLGSNQISNITSLANLKQVAELHLGANQISDITPLANLTQLRYYLGLEDNQISDITPLTKLVNLQKLRLAGNPVQDVSPLAKLIKLTDVDINIPNQIIAGGIIPDPYLAQAVRTALNLTNIQPITKQVMQRLSILHSQNNQISDLTGLEYATQLRELWLAHGQIRDISPLIGLTQLTTLHLQTNSLDESPLSDISPLADLTQLTSLIIGSSQIRDISPLAGLKQLTRLNLQANEIRDISPLAGLTQLETLWLVYNEIHDITPLANLTKLSRLGLYSNQIRDITPLANLTELETLSLASNPIEDASPLANLPKLVDVDIEIPQQYIATDVNKDLQVNKLDLLVVVVSLGQSATANPRADINQDGHISIEDLLLVILALDDPENAAAPASREIISFLDTATLAAHLSNLRAESDGSRKYQHAITFLENLKTAAPHPIETQLFANYPNPFNPETWIPYQLATDTEVQIHIYDAHGTLVRCLDLGQQSAGIYTSRSRAGYWDGRNSLGERVANGIYFYRLLTDDLSPLRKMVILK